MSKKQIDKNFDLAEKLANFLAKNPEKEFRGVSYVVFSAKDKALNKLNQKLLESLKKQGKKVVKAEETQTPKNSWKFSPVFSS